MDSKSNNAICSKSFTDINIDLGSKRIRHCCKATDEQYDQLTWYKINNTPGVVRRRTDSFKNIKNPQCNYCWKSNSAYRDIHNKSIDINHNWDKHVDFIEIKFDNVCDLSCIYCNENDSSTIAKEKKLKNPVLKYDDNDVNLLADYIISISEQRPVTINMLGGEPTLSRGYHKFIQKLIHKEKNSKNIFLVTTSNGNMHPSVLQKLNEYMQQTDWHWIWGFSGESTDLVFEQIRFGCKWTNYIKNVNYFVDNLNVKTLSFNPTINLLSIKTLPDYIEFINSIEKPFYLNGNYVLMPDILSIKNSPEELKKYVLQAKHNFKNKFCLNEKNVYTWFNNLYNLVGTGSYNKNNLQMYLQMLNIQKNGNLNISLLMDQIDVL